jgi:transposase-like protein
MALWNLFAGAVKQYIPIDAIKNSSMWHTILSLLCRQCRKRTHCYTGGIFWDKSDAKYTSYGFEFRLRAVTMYLNEQLGYRKIAKRMGIKDPKRVLIWVKNYQQYEEEGLKERRGKNISSKRGRPRKKPLTVEEENRKLKAENEFLKKFIALKRR